MMVDVHVELLTQHPAPPKKGYPWAPKLSSHILGGVGFSKARPFTTVLMENVDLEQVVTDHVFARLGSH